MGSEAVSQGQGKEEDGEEGRTKGKTEGQAGGWEVCPILEATGTRNWQEPGKVGFQGGKKTELAQRAWPKVPASLVTGL